MDKEQCENMHILTKLYQIYALDAAWKYQIGYQNKIFCTQTFI